MKLYKYSILTLLAFVGLVSCDDFLETEPNSDMPNEYALVSKQHVLGFYQQAYDALPERPNFNYEAASDNAITNRQSHSPSRAARGGISKIINPLGNTWEDDFAQINSLNWFLDYMILDESKPIPTPVRFDIDPNVNIQKFNFHKGQAFFLRAWYQFNLLKKYGGVDENNNALGFPISTDYLEHTDNLDLARNTYQECVDQISNDCDSAIMYLPVDYSSSNGTILDGLVADAGRASGAAAYALKTRAYLFQASPAYNVTQDVSLWQKAAEVAAEAIAVIGNDELMSLENYFSKAKINDGDFTNPDLFFRGPVTPSTYNLEEENFPPRAFSGTGKFNPTQDLVDAFPMNDGYPITESVNFDIDNEFADRDPRLGRTVVHDGETWAGIIIDSKAGGLDAYGNDQNNTRSGYYLKKFLDLSVNLEPGNVVRTKRTVYLLGRPELYLNFAEAALHATGSPEGTVLGYSAREMLAKVRDRALGAGNDAYLPTVTDQETFSQVIRNERRIELCFEDFRFWDLRRWSTSASDKSLINNPVHGIYSDEPVENRIFQSVYMPLPYNEMLKTENLVNNAGW